MFGGVIIPARHGIIACPPRFVAIFARDFAKKAFDVTLQMWCSRFAKAKVDFELKARFNDRICMKISACSYGPKRITEEQMEVALALDNKTIKVISEILVVAYKRAVAGELRIIDAWKIDNRSGDKKFQKALELRAAQYR